MKKPAGAIISFLITFFVLLTSVCPAQSSQEQINTAIDAATRTLVIEGVLKRVNDSYVFPDVAQKMERAIRERMQKKEYERITTGPELAQSLTNHLREVSRDKHLRVGYSARPIPPDDGRRREPTPEERENFRRFGGRINFGFEKIERMSGNIGYLNLLGFFNAELAGETAAAAMSFLANTDALIIDLRQNTGGDPAMVALLSSYLFGAEPVHLNDLYWREGNSTRQWWTLPYVPGRRYEGKEVYVLTSYGTFSAAEEFTYNLKNLKRATIIGETTGGGAHPGGGFRISDHFMMFVPTGRAINPISKTNWEGTGVKPDVEVPADLALKTAYVAALNKVAEKSTDEGLKAELKRLIERTQRELDEMKKQITEAGLKGNTVLRLKGYASARRVALAGSFNNWNMTQKLFVKEGDEWVVRVDLPPGKHTYKFVVDGGDWITDPGNPATEDDGAGNINSVLIVK